ncbi:WD40 repeat-like protein [Ramicandelaber brevisporus]|nr:WD40 repeat-like protein [Ramicandelaber brevisporus]
MNTNSNSDSHSNNSQPVRRNRNFYRTPSGLVDSLSSNSALAALDSTIRLHRRGLLHRTAYWSALSSVSDIAAKQLNLTQVLEGHNGCVNSLWWSTYNPNLLLSGSDDTKLVFWRLNDDELSLNEEDGEDGYEYDGNGNGNGNGNSVNGGDELLSEVYRIDTGHSANIFCARFMPYTSDRTVVSCARDGTIRVFDIEYASSADRLNGIKTRHKSNKVIGCHRSSVTRVVPDDNPYTFLSTSEDGKVRQHDLRVNHNCPIRQTSQFEFMAYMERDTAPGSDCPPPLVNYSNYGIELLGLTRSRSYPHLFAICGLAPYVYLHDRRLATNQVTAASRGGLMIDHMSRSCIAKFGPPGIGSSDVEDNSNGRSMLRRSTMVTDVIFSEENGSELLATWSGGNVNLFDINNSTALDGYTKQFIPRKTYNSIAESEQQQKQQHLLAVDSDNRPARRMRSLSVFDDVEQFDEHVEGARFKRARRGSQPAAFIPSRSPSVTSRANEYLTESDNDNNNNDDDDDDDNYDDDNNYGDVDESGDGERERELNESGGLGTDERHQHQRQTGGEDGEGSRRREVTPIGLLLQFLLGLGGVSFSTSDYSPNECEKRKPLITTLKPFSGHVNTKTTKECSFFGIHDEYIASGSDDGNVFIWDKQTARIVNVVHADNDIVNVLRMHPMGGIVAASGIDNSIKILTGRSPKHLRMPQLRPLKRRHLSIARSPTTRRDQTRIQQQQQQLDSHEPNVDTILDREERVMPGSRYNSPSVPLYNAEDDYISPDISNREYTPDPPPFPHASMSRMHELERILVANQAAHNRARQSVFDLGAFRGMTQDSDSDSERDGSDENEDEEGDTGGNTDEQQQQTN